MGGAGKALIGGGKVRTASSPSATAAVGGHGPIPHPLQVVRGQRFSPRRNGRHRIFVVTAGNDATVQARKEDERKELVTVLATRLLAVAADGRGLHYAFIAYTRGRRYRTFVYVADGDVDDRGLIGLVLPDWHPGRIVRFPQHLVPPAAQQAGSWMTAKADLGQPSGGALNIADLKAAPDPGPGACHRPTVEVHVP